MLRFLSRVSRARAIPVLLLIGSLLFSHAAVALQACTLDSPVAPSSLVAGDDCCGGMDSTLCHAHCNADKQSAESVKLPVFAAQATPVLRLSSPALPCSEWFVEAPDPPGLPVSIAFCVLRI